MIKCKKRNIKVILIFGLLLILQSNLIVKSYAKPADDTKKEEVYKTIYSEDKSIEEVYKDNETIYKDLGIENVINKMDEKYRNGKYNLIKRQIVLSNNVSSSDINKSIPRHDSGDRTVNLKKYNGYNMRYVIVYDYAHYNQGNILEDFKGTIVTNLIQKTVDVINDCKPTPYSTLASLLSFDVTHSLLYDCRADVLNCLISHGFRYNIFEINDKDHRMSSSDWYGLGYTLQDDVTIQLQLASHDKNKRPVTGNGEIKKTLYSPHFFNNTYMQQKIYEAYIGKGSEYYDMNPPSIRVEIEK